MLLVSSTHVESISKTQLWMLGRCLKSLSQWCHARRRSKKMNSACEGQACVKLRLVTITNRLSRLILSHRYQTISLYRSLNTKITCSVQNQSAQTTHYSRRSAWPQNQNTEQQNRRRSQIGLHQRLGVFSLPLMSTKARCLRLTSSTTLGCLEVAQVWCYLLPQLQV